MSDVKLSVKQAARILNITGRVDATPPKIKTAFLSVVGSDLKSSGLTVDDVRTAMQSAQDMGIEVGEEQETKKAARPARSRAKAESLKDIADREAEEAEDEAEEEEDDPKPAKAVKPAKQKAPAKERAPRPVKSTEPVEVSEIEAKKILKARKAENPDKWDKVKEITSFTSNGKPERVIIRCKDPETGEYTKATREIKVQDLFQVHYTVEDTRKVRSMARSAARAAKATPKPTKAVKPAKAAKPAKRK